MRVRPGGIHGWLTPNEAWQLHQEVRGVAERAGRPLSIVEIGSWKGRSAIAMGLALRASGHGGTIHCIDPQAPPFDNAAEFDANVERAGVVDLIRPVRALSHDARPSFEPAEIDVLFVDGAHDFPSVARDLDDWTPLLVHGGLLVVNDLFLPGVSRASRTGWRSWARRSGTRATSTTRSSSTTAAPPVERSGHERVPPLPGVPAGTAVASCLEPDQGRTADPRGGEGAVLPADVAAVVAARAEATGRARRFG